MNWQALVNQLHYSEGVPLEDARLYAGGIHTQPRCSSRFVYSTNTGDGLLAYNPFSVAGNQVFNADGSINPSAQMIYSGMTWIGPKP